MSRGGEVNLSLLREGAVLSFGQSISTPVGPSPLEDQPRAAIAAQVRMSWQGGNDSSNVLGLGELPGVTNDGSGDDPSAWQTGVSNFERVRYDEVYDGIDLEFYGRGGDVEFDWIIDAGIDPSQITMFYTGMDSLSVDAMGNLLVAAGTQQLIQHAPFTYQVVAGQRQEVASSYRLGEGGTVQFALGTYDPSLPLVIDPVLNYSTYFGGARNDSASGIAADADGNTYVIGTTNSTHFAEIAGPDVNLPRAFLAKFGPDGSLAYKTLLGPPPKFDASGYAHSSGRQIVIAPDGSPIVTFRTFETSTIPNDAGGGFLPVPGPHELHIAKFSPDGLPFFDEIATVPDVPGRLDPFDYLNVDMAIDATGAAYVTYGVVSNTAGGGAAIDPYIAKVSSDGSKEFTEPLFELPAAVAVDDDANIYLAFTTTRDDLTVSDGAFQPTRTGPNPSLADVYVAMFDPTATGIIGATYLGGSREEVVSAIAVRPDRPGRVYVGGTTFSDDFPLRNPFQEHPADGTGANDAAQNAFVALVDFNQQNAEQLVAATYFGGSRGDLVTDIELDFAGQVYVAGQTNSVDLPTVAPGIASWGAGPLIVTGVPIFAQDHFVAKFDSTLASLLFSTYFGGSGHDTAPQVAVSSDGSIRVAGTSAGRYLGPSGFITTADFPTLNAVQEDFGGGDVGFGVLETDAVVYSIGQRGVVVGRGSHATQGREFFRPVADFANAAIDTNPADYAVTIHWGDDTTSSGELVQPNPNAIHFQAVGTHQYEFPGAYPVIAQLENNQGGIAPLLNIDVAHFGGNQNGGSIAVNPIDVLRMFAAMSTEPATDTDPPGILVASSADAGQTWSPRLLAADASGGLPIAARNPDVLFDDFGNLFLAYAGADGNNIVVLSSTDGGRTFEAANAQELTPEGSVAGGENSSVGSPKLAFGAAHNEVWVTFEDLTNNRVVAAGAIVGGLGNVGAFELRNVSGSAGGAASDIAVGPNGDVAVVWQALSGGTAHIFSSFDLDGLGDGDFANPTIVEVSATDGALTVAAQAAQVPLGATLAWDTSEGLHHGRLYAAFVDLVDDTGAPAADGKASVIVKFSDDLGVNWTTPQPVTADPEFQSMFLPSIAIDPTTGNVGVGWYGTHDATSFTRFYVATSADGVHFSGAQQVSVEPSNALAAGLSPYAMEHGFGEAPGMAFLSGRLYPIWSDNSPLQDENSSAPEFDIATAIVGVISVAEARVAIRPLPIVAVRGEAFSGTVATFTHPDASRTAADYTVKILWGDGSDSPGTVAQPGGPNTPFAVMGTHSYDEAGSYPLSVEVTDIRSGLVATPVSNVTAQDGSQAEGTIAIDPTNPNRVFASGVDASRRGLIFRGIPVAASDDGGVTWRSGSIADGTDGLPLACCDPRAVYDQFGNLFLTYITIGAEDQVVLLLSTDGGQTFTVLHTAAIRDVDQPTVSVGPGLDGNSGSVWLTWEQTQGIWAAGASVTGLGIVGTFAESLVAVVTGPETLRNFGDISVGPAGQVLLSYVRAPFSSFNEIAVQLDPDGLGPLGFGAPVPIGQTNVPTGTRVPAQDTSRGIENRAVLDWDRSDGPHRGRVYLVYTDSASLLDADTNIFVRFSDNSGADWSEPIQVNDDATTNSQFLPSVAVDQSSGNLAVGWHTGVDNNVKTRFTVTMSDDGGSTFRVAYLVSPGESDSTDSTVEPDGQLFSYGDYTGMTFVQGVFQPIWGDNSLELESVPDPRKFDLANARIAVAEVSRPPLVVTAFDFDGIQGQKIFASPAHFTDPDGTGSPGDFDAIIDWGDGSDLSVGEISQLADGSFAVVDPAGHVYQHYGTFTVTVTITGPRTHGESTSTATIANGALDLKVQDELRVVRETEFTKTIGTLSDDNPLSVPSDYIVTIEWGDGSASLATLELDAAASRENRNVFQVKGTHKYLSENEFTVKISALERESGDVLDDEGEITSGDPSLEVNEFFLDIDALAGINTGGLVLVTFVLPDDVEVPLDTHVGAYVATINWGDGHVDANVIPFMTDEDVTIAGQHTYATAGDYFPSITLVDDSGGVFNVSLIARVSADVTTTVRPVGSGLIYNPTTERFVGDVTVTNTGGEALDGPFYVVFDGLPDGVSLENITDVTGDDDPVAKVSRLSLASGASLDPITVEFNNPSGVPITYTARVFSPSGSILGLLASPASLTFEPNLGQTDADVAFVARGPDYALFLTEDLAAIRMDGPTQSAAMTMRWRGGNDSPNVVGLQPQAGTSNYFTGAEQSAWISGVPNYGRVRYESVYDGIDLEYYGRDGELEFDWIVEPGGNPNDIVMEFAGAEQLSIDHEGNLRLQIGDGQVVQRAPVVYQTIVGQQRIVEGRYVVHADGTVGFVLGIYDPTATLVIDPVLLYSTYFGGPGTGGAAVAVDEAGNSYVTGSTFSLEFPTSVGAFQEDSIDQTLILDPSGHLALPQDAFVIKLDPNGVPIYSTYLSGRLGDAGVDIAVDATGQAYVLGVTVSSDFPTRGAFQPELANQVPPGFLQTIQDAFLLKLTPDGSNIIYSSFLGGEANDFPRSLTIDASGAVYVVGATLSRSQFPIKNAVQPQHADEINFSGVPAFLEDGFITKVDPSGSSLVFSTFLGGVRSDFLNGVVLDEAGNIIVVGSTLSNNLPTRNALQDQFQSIAVIQDGEFVGFGFDGLVAKLPADGSSLDVLSYLGGVGGEEPFDVTRDRDGNIVVAGTTYSTDFPTVNPFQAALADPLGDGFITTLNSALSQILYSTYLGGNGNDGIRSVDVDEQGNILVFGFTQSTDLPVVAPLQASLAGGTDGWVASLNPTANTLNFLTYLGGTQNEFGLTIFYERGGNAMAADSHGNLVLTGFTGSFDFPKYHSIDNPTFGDGLASRMIITRVASEPPPGFNRLELLHGSLAALEGSAIDGAIASFITVGQEQAADFTASIDWGDDTVSVGTVVSSTAISVPGRRHFNVLGSHVYQDLGDYDVLVTVRNAQGDLAVAPGTPAASDSTTPPDYVKYHVSIDTSSLSGQAGFFSAQFNPGTLPSAPEASLGVSKFIVSGGTLSPTIFTDGSAVGNFSTGATLSPGALLNRLIQGLVFGNQIDFDVLVSGDAVSDPTLGLFGQAIAFQLLGADRVTTLLAADPTGAITTIDVEPDGSTQSHANLPSPTASRSLATAQSFNLARIANAPIAASLTPIAVQEGAPFSDTVATFANANPFESASQHQASIDWGDGTITAGTIVTDAAGFHVVGTHTYRNAGNYQLSVVITEPDGAGASAHAGGGGNHIEASRLVIVGPSLAAHTVGDFNGDGHLDFASGDGNLGASSAFISFGAGNLQYVPSTTIPILTKFMGAASGDFNNDGIDDIAIAGQITTAGTEALGIVFGSATGALQAATTTTPLQPGFPPFTLTTADFDGDGFLDVAMAYGNGTGGTPNFISVLRGLGDGTFEPRRNFVVDIGASNFAVADVNADGRDDLVVANTSSANIRVLLGTAGSTFLTPLAPQSAGGGVNSLAIADMNLDGIPDLVGASGSLAVMTGVGDGTFSLVRRSLNVFASHVATGDLNGDGRPDVVVDDNLGLAKLFAAQLDGTFVETQSITRSAPRGVRTSDLDHDGRLDVILQGSGGLFDSFRIFPGRGDGTVEVADAISTGSNSQFQQSTADVNGDGFVDLLSNIPAGLLVTLGRGDGTFVTAPSVAVGGPTNNKAREAVIVDINNDGRNDIVAGVGTAVGTTPGISILLRNADGTYQVPIFIGLTRVPLDLAVGDVNGDSRPDIVATFTTNNFAVLLNQVGGSFAAPQFTATLAGGCALLLQDLNNDGKLDVAVQVTGTFVSTPQSFPNAGAQVFYGVGNGTFLPPVVAVGPVNDRLTASGPMAAGDLNGDSIPDIVTSGAGFGPSILQGGLYIALGNSNGTFTQGQRYIVGGVSGDHSVALGDFNHDGKLDAAVSRYFGTTDRTDDVVILFGNGDGTLQAPVNYDVGVGAITVSGGAGMVRGGDVNGDGWLDLVLGATSVSGQGVAVLMNRGDGTFEPAAFYYGGLGVTYVGLGDLDMDGMLDVAAVNFDPGTINLLYNRGDGTLIGQYTTAVLGNLQYMDVADANGDGILDVAYTARGANEFVGLLVGRGDGHFDRRPQVTIPPVAGTGFSFSGPIDLKIGDTDGSGVDELIVGLSSVGSLLSLPILPGGSLGPIEFLTSIATNSARFAFGDFNADGRMDVARVGNLNGDPTFRLRILTGQADGSFVQQPQSYATGFQTMDLVAADFNGDGRLDLAVVSTGTQDQNHTGSGIYVLIGVGDGTFASPLILEGGFPYSSVTAADMNGDSVQDLVLGYAFSNFKPNQNLAVMYSRGDGTFKPPIRFDMNSSNATSTPTRITTGDFAGDGFPDIVASMSVPSDLNVRIIRNVALPAGADVANAPLSLVANDLNPSAGIALVAVVGSFLDDNPLSMVDDFTATIRWGDGQSSAGSIEKLPDGQYQISASHLYANAGTYNTTITLNEAQPFTRYTAAGSVVVSEAILNVADAGPDQTVLEGLAVTLDGLFVGSDPTDTPTYLWQVVSSNGQLIADGNSPTFSFTPSDNGTYIAQFTVTTGLGAVSSDSATITVTNALPSVALGGPGSGTYGQSLAYSLGADDPSTVDDAAGFAYVIHWADGSPDTAIARVAGNATGLNVSHTFAAAGQYSVLVTSTDKDGGTSLTSVVPVTVDKAHLSVTAGDKTKVYGSANPSLSASIAGFVSGQTLATSGVTGQPTLALVGDGVHVGQYVISVGLGSLNASNYDFPAASLLSGTLNVSPATLTIAADNKSKAYGAALPPLTADVTGFVNGDTATVLTAQPALATSATAASHVGSYPITVGGAAAGADYSIQYVSGTLNVTPVALRITAESKSKVYGAAIVALTAAYDGFVNGDAPADLTTPPNLATTATAASHVGTYPITVTGAADPDYLMELVDGLFAVTPAVLTITAESKSKVYGAAIVQLTASYAGLANGDTPASLNTPPALATTATAASSVGSYPITATGAADPDYTITHVPGTYGVTPAPLSIKADDKNKSAGEVNPPLTFTPTGFVNGDTAANLTPQPALSTTATTDSPTGAYPITASSAASPNYTISYLAGTLTVTGVVAGGSISGIEYLDVTGNGLTPDDTRMSGVQVYVDLNNNSALSTGEPVTTSSTDGTYAINGLAAGTHKVRQVTPTGYIRTAPAISDFYSVTLSSGQTSSGNHFANAALGDRSVLTNIVYVINGTTAVSDLIGKTKEGDTVQVSFTIVPGTQPNRYTLVSYTAPGKTFDWATAAQQKIFQIDTGVFGPGSYTLDVRIPHSYYQVDFVIGSPIEPFGPSGSNIFYSAQARLVSYDNSGTKVMASNASSLSGFVYHDANNNSAFDAGERPIPGAAVALSGKDSKNNTVSQSVVTDVAGRYQFTNLPAGTYTITEAQPGGYTDGSETLGSRGGSKSNDKFSSIWLPASASGTNYNFGEKQTVGAALAANQSGTTGFWNGTSGQSLIKALNGGQSAKNLGNWLASNFGNLFGSAAGSSNNQNDKTNSQVASYFKTVYSNTNRNAEAEALALALKVYVTNSSLAGNTAQSYGFAVSSTGLGAATINVATAGTALGLDNNSVLTVSELLLRLNLRSRKGLVWDADTSGSLNTAETVLRNQAQTLLAAINNT